MTRIFNTLAQPAEYTYEVKRSQFIARAWSVTTKEEGFEHFDQIKKSFPDARHYCWAYLLGDPEQALTAGFNDDGEPGGTAGKPMLHVLTQRKIGNVFAVVVRYFGGIKLGAGGLTRAYGHAISGAIDLASLQPVIPHDTLLISTTYPLEDRVRNIIKQFGLQVEEAQYSESVALTCQCPQHLVSELNQQAIEETAGNVDCRQLDKH